MKSLNLFIFILLLLLFFVDCSVEEVNKLRSEWKDKFIENNEIMKEVKKLKNNFIIENLFFSKISTIKTHLITLNNFINNFLIKEEDEPDLKIKTIISKKVQTLKELDEIKNMTEIEFKNAKNLLLIKEQEFEEFWDDEYFLKSFDFILQQSLMTPVPKFPQIYAEIGEKNVITKALKWHLNLTAYELELIQIRTEKLKKINKKIFEIENE